VFDRHRHGGVPIRASRPLDMDIVPTYLSHAQVKGGGLASLTRDIVVKVVVVEEVALCGSCGLR
jgi:hypothetical protein